jgi:hypothetical protein
MHPEKPDLYIKGIYRDRLIRPDGSLARDSGWQHNMIVLRCRILLAAFLRNDVNSPMGIQGVQVGRGDPSWDHPPATAMPDAAHTDSLVDPLPFTIPVDKLEFRYLTDHDVEIAEPSHRIEVTMKLDLNEPPPDAGNSFPLREFGLFGELDGKPCMIDYVRHPLIEKDSAVMLERKIRLVL